MIPATLTKPPAAASPDLSALKAKQHAAWSSGDYAVVGATLQIMGESLCEAMDLRGGQKVLDVAAGNGNVTLAAARRWCDVTSTDYVESLLERGRARAQAEGWNIKFQEADAEALPFKDASFDAIVSTVGVMFVADHAKAAKEMLRVCKPGGKIGMASWTPDGYIGQLFKTIGKYVAPPPGAKSPALWGTQAHLDHLFGPDASSIVSTKREFMFRYRSAQHCIDIFKTYYGPVLKTFGALSSMDQAALKNDMLALIDRFNRATDGTMVVPAEYLEVVIVKR
jgi:ubiquinone/menaquinone biosynthesis C-methylase UbiE